MIKLYYWIWSDSILSLKKYHPKKVDWKSSIFIMNTWINATNAWIIFVWLKWLGVNKIQLVFINLFPGDLLDKFLSFSIVFALPFGFLNYFLIFYKDRYKTILKNYSTPPNLYAFSYSMIVVSLAFITVLLGVYFQ